MREITRARKEEKSRGVEICRNPELAGSFVQSFARSLADEQGVKNVKPL